MSDLWRFIPLSEFASPTEPATEAVRTRMGAAWNRLTALFARRHTDTPKADAPLLHSAPESFLNRLVPAPDWAAVGPAALDVALKGWLGAGDSEAGCCTVVFPPHSGIQGMISAWAGIHELTLVPPPAVEQLLRDKDGWLADLTDRLDQRLVLPQLGKCYLRHEEGLALVRSLLDAVRWYNPPWVLACDSWAWAYLSQATDAGAFLPRPLTGAPLQAPALAAWLRQISANRLLNPVTVRQTTSDQPILTLAGDSDRPLPTDEATSDFISHLAAFSRGNPGVAWALWRHCLHVGEEQELHSGKELAAEEAGYTIWAHPWDKSIFPAIPAGSGLDEAFVLHALLLHDGLSHEWLVRLLPLPAGAVTAALEHLHAAGLVTAVDGTWRVTAAGYPAVRIFLRGQALLIDAL